MPNRENQTELEALITLLARGVITQEQFDQLSADLANSPSATPPLPPPMHSKASGKRKVIAASMIVVLLVAIGVGLAVREQKESERRKTEVAAQVEQEKREREESELRAMNQKACTDRSALATAWSDYVGALTKNNDASRASSLRQANRWSFAKSDATSAFRRVLKQIDHPDVESYRDSLLRQVNLLEDAYTLMGGADTWSEFNSLVTTTNLLGNDLNEYKEDIFDAIRKACNGTSN